MIVNGPTDIVVHTGTIGIISCGFVNASNQFVPNWNIVTRSDSGSVTSNMTVNTVQINSDNNNGNPDGLVYEHDLTSGPMNATNSRLLVGPVDQTYNQSSYQCSFLLAGGTVVSTSGTLTVAGEYKITTCKCSILSCVPGKSKLTVMSHEAN